jgi:hypothetical protein
MRVEACSSPFQCYKGGSTHVPRSGHRSPPRLGAQMIDDFVLCTLISCASFTRSKIVIIFSELYAGASQSLFLMPEYRKREVRPTHRFQHNGAIAPFLTPLLAQVSTCRSCYAILIPRAELRICRVTAGTNLDQRQYGTSHSNKNPFGSVVSRHLG